MFAGNGSASTILHLVGLGPGPVELLTLRAWELIASGKPLWVRDPDHEAAQTVLARGFRFERSAETDPFALSAAVLEWAKGNREAVYAVPGSPMDAPETLSILQAAPRQHVEVDVVPSVGDLDRVPGDLQSGIPPSPEAVRAGQAFARLVSLMALLRAPGGCPWDRRQTHETLAIHLLEETYETLDAIDRQDIAALAEELGDIQLQVVFHSQLAAEEARFGVVEVLEELIRKLVDRHPHVFGDVVVTGADEVVANWEALKHEQKRRASTIDDLPKNLPALLYAHKVQRRLSGRGVDAEPSPSRIAELAAAAATGDEDALGRLLYEVVGVARRAGTDPEGELRRRATAEAEAEAGRGAAVRSEH